MSGLYAGFDLLGHGGFFAFPLALLAGVMAGLNPCCVVLYPAAAAMCCGTNAYCGPATAGPVWRLKNSIAFVLGIAVAATMLGLIAALAGRVMGQLGPGVRYAVAIVPLVMGLHLLGWLRLPIGARANRAAKNGLVGAFGGGFLLSLALTPCGTPILASVLSYVAYKGSFMHGAMLLFLYGIGSGVPVVLVGTTAARLTAKLDKAGYSPWSERISGTALLMLGFFLIWRA